MVFIFNILAAVCDSRPEKKINVFGVCGHLATRVRDKFTKIVL